MQKFEDFIESGTSRRHCTRSRLLTLMYTPLMYTPHLTQRRKRTNVTSDTHCLTHTSLPHSFITQRMPKCFRTN